jgi:phage-related protein (TIGR01555 family)
MVARKKKSEPASARADRWVNRLTAIGHALRDKTQSATFEVENVPESDAEQVWRGDDLGAKIVELPPAEMFRKGYALKIGGDVADKEEIERAMSSRFAELRVNAMLRRALEYRRAYGGGAVLVGADDKLDLAKPLDPDKIQSLMFLTVLRPRELTPRDWYRDATLPKYGEPETWSLMPDTDTSKSKTIKSSEVIHESRLIIFRGPVTSRQHLRERNGFGDSVFVRLLTVLAQFHQIWGGSANLLSDFSQAVLKIKGLAELLSGNKRDDVMNRAAAIDMSRSIARSVILDSEEEWLRQATPMNGFAEMVDRWMLRVAGAVDIPATKLFRQAPAGMNATGESDIRLWYDDIGSAQRDELLPALEKIAGLAFRAKSGPTGGVEPESWTFKFHPLWQLTEKEQAERNKSQSEADDLYIANGTITPEEVAQSRFGGEEFSLDTKLDIATREAYTQALARTEPTAPADPSTTSEGGSGSLLTPTDIIASIVRVNQALGWLNLPPLAKPDGSPDPDGALTVSQYQAKNATVIAAAASATSGQGAQPPAAPGVPPVTVDRADAMAWFMAAQAGRRGA